MGDTARTAPSRSMKPAMRRLRHLAWLVVIIAIIGGAIGGIMRGLQNDPDWRAFAVESRYALEHRAIRTGTGMF